MILGIGTDLCDIARIERVHTLFGQRFLDRCFTPLEQAYAHRKAASRARMGTFAKRFAAKEAGAKALGTGFRRGVFWRDIEVYNLPLGQPTLRVRGGAALQLARLLPDGYQAYFHLTLTDEYPLAFAYVMIEARREEK